MRTHHQMLTGVTAASGEPMALTESLSYNASSQPLAHFLADLEVALRLSLKTHTKNCMEACGAIQVRLHVCIFAHVQSVVRT